MALRGALPRAQSDSASMLRKVLAMLIFRYLLRDEGTCESYPCAVRSDRISAEERSRASVRAQDRIDDEGVFPQQIRGLFKIEAHGRLLRVLADEVKVIRVDALHMIAPDGFVACAPRRQPLEATAESEQQMRLDRANAQDEVCARSRHRNKAILAEHSGDRGLRGRALRNNWAIER